MVPHARKTLLVALAVLLWALAAAADTAPSDPDASGRVVVKFVDAARVRLRAGGPISLAGADLGSLRQVLDDFGHPEMRRVFLRPEAAIEGDRLRAEGRVGHALPDLNSYVEVLLPSDDVPRLIRALSELPLVQTAYPALRAGPPPVDIPPATPDFEPQQGYLDAAPDGIDARSAWTFPGGRGTGVTVIDVEQSWRDTHEDLGAALGQVQCFTPESSSSIEHGTAVLGILVGGDNGYGVTGIASEAAVGMVTTNGVGIPASVSGAIDCASSLVGEGDVILIEWQTDELKPVEIGQAAFDAIIIASALGITVIEAAGNGGHNLEATDDALLFAKDNRDSRAVLVGAGAPPGLTQPSRSRLSFSNFAERVNVQAWGTGVVTTGYGNLFNGGGDPDQRYTSGFGGTSSASAIIAGVAAALQGAQLGRGGVALDPQVLRRHLQRTGSAQQDGPHAGAIGPLPDLASAVATLPDMEMTLLRVLEDPGLSNADGVFDPGETAALRITVKNFGAGSVADLTGVLGTAHAAPRITRAEADWPGLDPGDSSVAMPVLHEVTLQPDATCGERVAFSLDLAGNPYEQETDFQVRVGKKALHYFENTSTLSIPNDAQGVSSAIAVAPSFDVAGLQLYVDILHNDLGDLRVVLESPSGTTVTLHDHGGQGTQNLETTFDLPTALSGPGSFADFAGEPAPGTWLLHLIDDVGSGAADGLLLSWSVVFTAFECNPLACAEPLPPPVGATLRLEFAGAADILLTWDAVPAVGAYRLWRSDEPTMAGEKLLVQTAGSSHVDPGAQSAGDGPLYYQVRSVNACEWEEP